MLRGMKVAVATAASAALALLGASALAPIASANTPGQPGTPSAPTPIFTENFEHNMGTTPVLLSNYSASNGTTYTADGSWLTACNGIVMSASSVGPGDCSKGSDFTSLQALASALGSLPGGPADASQNHVVAAFTENNPGANKVELQTTAPISLPSATGRFVTFSVDAAAKNCYASGPEYQFSLLSGTSTIPVGGTINPCAGNPNASAAQVGTFTSNGSVLLQSSSVGIKMVNANGSGIGNDAAFDNIRLLDVTPQLDTSFGPSSIAPGGTSTLTFTITNTSELAEKDGWGFSGALPAGVTIAGSASTTCAGGTITAPTGGTSVSVTGGDLAASATSCTVTVPVTSTQVGTYTLQPADVTVTGLDKPLATTLQVAPVVGTPIIDPLVGGGVAVVVLAIGGGLYLERRRRQTV